MLLSAFQVEIFDLQAPPILLQNGELLLRREMIKIIELDQKEFTILSMVITLLQHKSVEAFPPSCSDRIVLALPTAGSSLLTLSRRGLRLIGKKLLAFKLADQGIEHTPTDLTKWPKQVAEDFAEFIPVMRPIHEFPKDKQLIDETLVGMTRLCLMLRRKRILAFLYSLNGFLRHASSLTSVVSF